MRKLLLVLPFLLMTKAASAQLITYLSLEGGPLWSLNKVADPGHQFQRANVMTSMAGFILGQEIIPNLFISTGIYYVPRKDGINMMDDRPHQSRWTSYNSIMIPLRAEYRIQPTEYPFSFSPRIGYMYGTVSPPETSYRASGILSSPDHTAFAYDLTETFTSQSLHLLEVGIGLNLRINGVWQASLNLSYLNGFTEPTSTTVDYTSSGTSVTSATYSGHGNALSTTLAFSIPVSNLWQNRDYRVRARIENSVYKGKPADRKGQVYVGAEIGSLWRLFSATNPAVGPRPMSERGMFSYANLHGGGYLGYMLTGELGIDAGIMYQGSSTFYAIMYDHEVDFVTKSPAPMYLELPLRVRYFYPVCKKRLFLAVYGGASLLTSITGGSFDQGGGNFTYNPPDAGSPLNASTAYEATRLSHIRPLMRLGTGVEYELPMEFPLIATFYVNYMNGFTSTDQISVTNSVQESPSTSAITYNGSGWSVDIGIKVPFRFGEKGHCGKLPERE